MTSAIPADTLARQARACDPFASAWVGANAGSGKTFVLTQRVVRLLLAGIDPGRILCLTFTKAAAAEMATRVFDRLSGWTRLDDAALAEELEKLEGRRPGREGLVRARRLFARALETPGGLKIQTIHAFCEALLHQFPLEANVAGHFEVLDDRGQAELLAEAQASLLHRTAEQPEGRLADALQTVMARASDWSFQEAIAELVAKRETLSRFIAASGSLDAGIAALAADFGLESGQTPRAIAAEADQSQAFSSGFLAGLLPELEASDKATDAKLLDRLRAALGEHDPEAKLAAWTQVFFTQNESPRTARGFATKAIKDVFPDLEERLGAECERLGDVLDRYRAAITVEATAAISRLAEAVIARYEARKAALGLLDFDDLVSRTADLLSSSEAARWVQYKLDLGLDHVLVDEGQDTSPRQWDVITQLVGDFFSGEGRRERPPTVFAVGDEKQSIYSFQGAAPRLFGEKRKAFGRAARDAGLAFHDERLNLSFRSSPDVLAAVDTVFAAPEHHEGLSEPPAAPIHEAIRRGDPGLVEVWPLMEAETVTEPEDWTEPLDHEGPAEPARRLAERIADTVAGWIASGARLEGTGRRITPGDVLVLVRKRGAFVDALNRALKDRQVPAAGSDRLAVTDHIAVMDLISLGRAALLPADDLSLAEVLKSPLVGFDEETLFDLGHDRDASLAEALFARRKEPQFAAGHGLLARAIGRADRVPPYEFFADILGPFGGRAKFRGRLGAEVDEVLDAFLALALSFEETQTPSLQGFLSWLSLTPTEIKRQQDSVAREVRIMTVHGAKGLEAPVVFLVDPASAPFSHAHAPKILQRELTVGGRSIEAPVWTPGKPASTDWHRAAIDAYKGDQEDEYRRLLYVAMTRARDRLIVCGYRGTRTPPDTIWHRVIEASLSPEAEEIRDTEGAVTAWRWRKIDAPPREATGDEAEAVPAVPRPDWLTTPAPPPPRIRPLAPSRAFGGTSAPPADENRLSQEAMAAALSPGIDALQRGRLVHLLLQHLPGPAEERRPEMTAKMLEKLAPDLGESDRAGLIAEVFSVLDHPDFRHVFASEGRAEVAIVGTLRTDGGETLSISGQIDRLIATDNAVLIVDYKTNREVPGDSAIPEDYVVQLALYRHVLSALYPGRTVRAALLWTAGPALVELEAARLDAALQRLRAGGSGEILS
ncbi:double-strand break repair helicase AddA [Rhodobium gokarnense]|uniref:DNA 3'-5' helicase n=1 Tax=Rhodobium gokarnense TaxID=364296 RepID=A0ABT3HEJ6_9HYPH|nr:double-strand break repair helicase AddA [Rhodobium gokarnense]MCW2308795.1 ATP-dependent helicase/nuclease subunit A [Rhodobium gokarnense]